MRLLGVNVDRFIADTGNVPYSLINHLGARETIIRTLQERTTPAPLIFSISSGRAGSGFLAALLGASADAAASHEPRPRMSGVFVRNLSAASMMETYARRRIKIIQILRQVGSLPSGFTYAETSHMFVKTFYDVVLDHFDDVRIVHLRRDLPQVIKSFAELGYFTDASTHWRHWMHDPFLAQPLLPPAVDEAEADSFDKIIAYLVDIEARAAALRCRYPDVPTETVRIEELEDPDVARRLIDRLGLEWTTESAEVCARRANRRAEMKRVIARDVDVAYCRERLERYVELAGARSIPLPAAISG